MKKIFLGVFISIIALFVYGNVEAKDPVTVTLPKAIVTSNYNNSYNFYVSIERLNSSSPMPSDSDVSTVTITGNDASSLGNITFTKNGDYEYKIYQDKKNLSDITYDNTVYYLTIQVRNDSGNIYKTKVTTILKKQGSNIKEKEVVFTNEINQEMLSVTYKLNGGAINNNTADIVEFYPYNTKIAIHDAPIREGYKFLYWKGSVYQPGDEYIVTKNKIFTAQWEPIDNTNNSKKDNNNPKTPFNRFVNPYTADTITKYFIISIISVLLILIIIIYVKNSRDDD